MKNIKPDNALKYPISELIEKLQKLPPETTFEYDGDQEFFGGQCTNGSTKLGTGYAFKVSIIEGYLED